MRLRARIVYPAGIHSSRFALLDQTDGVVSSAKLAGRPYLLVFLSTRCSASCRASLARIASATNETRTRVVLVTTTPRIDTRNAIRVLLAKVHATTANLSYSTRPARNVTRLMRANGYSSKPVRILRCHLIDKLGNLRAEFVGDFAAADLAHDAGVLARA